jgi:microcystin-dependent protein
MGHRGRLSRIGANLFSAIGTNYGAGDGTSTFNLPDCRGRNTIGAGQGTGLSNRVVASVGGEETHTLSLPERDVYVKFCKKGSELRSRLSYTSAKA